MRQHRLPVIDTVVLRLHSRGLTSGEISAHFAEACGASVPEDTITRITDSVLEEMSAWWSQPLERVYAAILVDVIAGLGPRRACRPEAVPRARIGVDLDGRMDILAMSAGDGSGESAKYWMAVLTDIRDRGVKGACSSSPATALLGLPDAVDAVWSDAVAQTCIIDLIRNSLGYVSRRSCDQLSRDLRPIDTASSERSALLALDALNDEWSGRYPAMIRSWRSAWREFVPFLDYDVEIRTVICSTNAVDSPGARSRRAVKARGRFPNTQAAMKTLYLVPRPLDPKGTGQTRWAVRWKPALNAFAITFADRMPATETT